jgi:hypothetical protein
VSARADREAVFQRGVEAYRTGLYYEAHEFWEQLWDDEDDDAHRRFLQSLIQITSAVHKLQNDVAPNGALKLLERALGRLEGLPSPYGGIALDELREGTTRLREAAERRLAAGERGLPLELVPRLERADDSLPWRRRSDDPVDSRRQLQLGVAAYRRGEFFEAHELWEVAWREEPDPTMKAFLHGLILTAAGMHKLEKMHSVPGAVRLLGRAETRLSPVPDGTGGMAVRRLCQDLVRARGELEARDPSDAAPLAAELVPRMEPLLATA